MNFKLKLIKRGKKKHFIIPPKTIGQDNINVLNIDAPKSCVLDLIRSILLEIKTEKQLKQTITSFTIQKAMEKL